MFRLLTHHLPFESNSSVTLADESVTLVTVGAEYGLSRYRSVTVVAGSGELMPVAGEYGFPDTSVH